MQFKSESCLSFVWKSEPFANWDYVFEIYRITTLLQSLVATVITVTVHKHVQLIQLFDCSNFE